MKTIKHPLFKTTKLRLKRRLKIVDNDFKLYKSIERKKRKFEMRYLCDFKYNVLCKYKWGYGKK